MSLLPYLISMVAGAIGWAGGKKLGLLLPGNLGFFLGAVFSLVLSILGFYYGRKYVKDFKETMGG